MDINTENRFFFEMPQHDNIDKPGRHFVLYVIVCEFSNDMVKIV